MTTPPEKRWHTREDSGIRLDREGRWWHDGELVEHPRIVEAFNRGLVPAEGGKFKLHFGRDWCFVEVEDAAYRVTDVVVTNDAVRLSLSDGREEVLDPETLFLDHEGVVGCTVKAGAARARFSRHAQFQLGSHLEEHDGRSVLLLGPNAVALPFRWS